MNSLAKTTDEYLNGLPEWQKVKLQEFRDIIHSQSDAVSEEIKWGVPSFILSSKVTFVMAAFKNHVKYNFIRNGALLDDPDNLFNNGLESPKSRGIDLQENDIINKTSLASLVEQAISK